MREPERRAAILAEALLAEGMLRESDWCGSIRETIAAGMLRWVQSVLGGQELQRIEFGILWTDDLVRESRRAGGAGGPGINPRLWIDAVPGRKADEPVGVLGLRSEIPEDRYPYERDVCVGRTVLEFEAVRPGLGYQLLYLLQEVLPPTLCVATPFWAFDQALKAQMVAGSLGPFHADHLDMGDMNLHLPMHGVTLELFREHVPDAACVGEIRLGVIRKAIAAQKGPKLPERLRAIVTLAAEVVDLFQRYPKEMYFAWDTHSLCRSSAIQFLDVPGGANVEGAFAVRWSPLDPIPLVVQDYLRQIREPDAATNLIWSRGWQASNPDALRRSVREFKHVLRVALRACQLAELMHSDEPPPALGRAGRTRRSLIAPISEPGGLP